MELTQEKLADIETITNPKSLLAKAVLDDTATRLQGEHTARTYLRKKWAREDGIPYWMWAIGWSAFGVLLCLSILSSGVTVLDMIKGITP